MSKKKQCMSCGFNGMVHESRDLPFAYKGVNTIFHSVEGWYCPACGDAELDDMSSYSNALDSFSAEVDTSIAKELARIRKRLKLTQQQAALLSGGGVNAFSRYERGEAKPLSAVVNLFRLLDLHPELLKEIQPV
jgi:HTH-type transcriptional regulator/antitoxin MqsA